MPRNIWSSSFEVTRAIFSARAPKEKGPAFERGAFGKQHADVLLASIRKTALG